MNSGLSAGSGTVSPSPAQDPFDPIDCTFNSQGQRKSRKDQNGTLRGFLFDKLGRLVHDYVEVLAPGVDGRVRRITREYGCASRLISISAYTHPCARTGAVVNQLVMGYNEHGLLSAEYQSHTGPVDMAATPCVQYGYDDTAESGEFVKGLRPTRVVYPNGRIVRYEYGDAATSSSSSGPGAADPDDCLNRVKFIAEDDEGQVGTHLAEYRYLGLGAIVTEDYPEPQVKLDYTPDGYSGFDRFGRVIDHRWRNHSTGEDLDRYQYTHDRAGNRTSRRNLTTTERDEFYVYDGLYRLVRADRGNLDAATYRIAGTPDRQESWTLDATGNWSRHQERESGHAVLDQTRQHNRANELLSFSASVGDPWSNPAHDRNGNMTRIPKPANPRELLNLRWDAWDRLVKATDSIGLVAAYEYDGRNFRVLSHTYRDPANPDTVLTNPISREFYHNARWQVLEERTADSPSLPERHYIYSLRYIDAPILRDRRVLCSPTSLSERLYYLGDANYNVTALVSPTGAVQERYTYTPYGDPSYFSPDWRPRLSSAFSNRILYTGRALDPETGLYYYRARYYQACLGSFVARDPTAAETNLYRYCANSPVRHTDPQGLLTVQATGDETRSCGALRVRWDFVLSKPGGYPFEGYIVQHVEVTDIIRECPKAGSPNWSGIFDAKPTEEFWEYWDISPRGNRGTDNSVLGWYPNNQYGLQRRLGEIRFYPRAPMGSVPGTGELEKNPNWGRGKTKYSHHATTIRPDWWDKPPLEGPVKRYVSATWCCCGESNWWHEYDYLHSFPDDDPTLRGK